MVAVVASTSAISVTSIGAPLAGLTTVAERSGWKTTGRYEEVESLCAAFPKKYPGKVRCERFGTTPLGRPMWMLVLSDDGTFGAQENQKKRRPVVLFQGGIHAGEIDGKDAGFWLVRDVLDGKVAPGALARVTLVFIPVLNVDGHERFGPNHRPNQRGPEEMGWRVTSQNLNLNRDFMKADAPEMQAVLRVLHRYDPILFADLHVTDGAKFQHDVAVTFEPWLTGPEHLRALGKGLKVALFSALEAQGHLPVGFYPSFIKEDEPSSGFAYGWPPPRFSSAYWALQARFGMLVETHSWKPYAERVKSTYDVCAGLLTLAAEDGTRWRKAADEADAAMTRRAGTEIVLMYDTKKQSKPLEFRGFAYTSVKSEVSGKQWIRYDESNPETWTVPYFDELEPALTLKAPAGGYLVPRPHAQWVAEKLDLHGLRYSTVRTGVVRAKVERFLVEPKFRPLPYEGRLTVQAKGEWAQTTMAIAPGTLFVPAAQRGVALVMHLFEPVAPDSLLAWGFFNAHLEQKEYMEDYVTEEVARTLLEDAGIRAAFDARLKDESFAKDPAARLRFFSSKHPSHDATLNVLPVYRTDATY
jgi:murein tripeptide amidase MpaA